MARVAILGGTFDPVHWGHFVIAQTALSQLRLDRVIWVPTHHPPHKRGLGYEHRRLMLEDAIANYPAFVLYALETDRTTPDYAICTLINLQKAEPNCQWYWIIGLDAFQTLPRWYRRETLIPACDWLVAPRLVPVVANRTPATASNRTNFRLDHQNHWLCQQVVEQLAAQDISINWQLLQMPPIGISSSLIRQYCHQHRSIRELVPENVATYITTHNLYSYSESTTNE